MAICAICGCWVVWVGVGIGGNMRWLGKYISDKIYEMGKRKRNE